MAGKTSTGEPSWRPLAKLSGLIARRSSAKGRKPREATDERGSIFGFKRESKIYAEEEEEEEGAAPEFKPLEVDVGALEGLRLPPSWLHIDTENANLRPKQQVPAAANASTSPIADLFAGKSVFETPNSAEKPPPAYSQTYGNHFTRKPVPTVEVGAGSTALTSHARVSTDTSRAPADAQSIYSVLDRGRPIESRHAVPDVPKVPRSARHSFSAESAAATIHQADITDNAHVARLPQSSISKFAAAEPSLPPQRVPRPNRTSLAIQRHSMYEGAVSPTDAAPPKPRPTTIAPRSVSAAPTDRIQSWQKSSASRSSSVANSQPPSVHATAPSASTAPVRRLSARGGVASNRLAWIKELEEKRSAGVNRDLGVLKKQVGSVSDKLAMFESKQTLAAPTARHPPLTRSNSTNRFSGAGYESIFSAESNTASASQRTSIDTVRTNQRESSVMSHFDDTFREKLESLMGSGGPDKDKNNTSEQPRTSSRSVSGESKLQSKPEAPTVPEVARSDILEGTLSSKPQEPLEPEKSSEPAASTEPEAAAEPEVAAELEVAAEPEVAMSPETRAEAPTVEPQETSQIENPSEPALATEPTKIEPAEPELNTKPEMTKSEELTPTETEVPEASEALVDSAISAKPELPMELQVSTEPESDGSSGYSGEFDTSVKNEVPAVEPESPVQPESSTEFATVAESEKPTTVEPEAEATNPIKLDAAVEPEISSKQEELVKLTAPAEPVELNVPDEAQSSVGPELPAKTDTSVELEVPSASESPVQFEKVAELPSLEIVENTQTQLEEKAHQAPQEVALPLGPEPEEKNGSQVILLQSSN